MDSFCFSTIDVVCILFINRVSIVEESAIRELREKLYANKRSLMAAFEEKDKENTGKRGILKPLEFAVVTANSRH